jgi:hypothetical protein
MRLSKQRGSTASAFHVGMMTLTIAALWNSAPTPPKPIRSQGKCLDRLSAQDTDYTTEK